MTPAEIVALIQGFFQFPTALLAVIKALQQTPAQQQAALIVSIQKEAANFATTGRPTWS